MSLDDDAARWFAVLRRGVMTLEERTAYQQWMRLRQNRDALAAMDEQWRSLQAAVPPPRRKKALTLAFAAICVLMLGTGVMSSMQSAFWTELDWKNR